MPEEARNRQCKLLLFSLLLVTSYCLKFMVTNLLQRKLFIFLRIEAKFFTVELGSPALVSLFPVLYLPSIPGLPLLLLFVFISLSFILPKTPLTCHFFFLTYRARLIFIMSLKSNISLKSLKSKTLLRSLWAKRRIQLEPNNLLHFWIHFIFQFHQLPNFISQRYVKRLSFLFCFVSWMSFPPLYSFQPNQRPLHQFLNP
ncbi:hypothetical protein ES332_D06G124700v1 [Gossypium tomentosum]|uniref:Transmembrane protein n=1 Tax=Gossypium tomentosum TaxID=34277 RepID=A0A5D2KH50_GOSTO|nr:hypothetical protein ES332_D06G124700v1 [Gossypium tomentosum]